MKRLLFAFLLLFCVTSSLSLLYAHDLQNSNVANSSVTLHRTEILRLTSFFNGQTYPIFIALLGRYFYSDQTSPVVFMLDASSSFGIMTQTARLLEFNKEVPE